MYRFRINIQRRFLRHGNLGPASGQFGDQRVAVERLVRDQTAELGPSYQGSDANCIVALAGQKDETDEVAQRVGKRQDFVVRPPRDLPIAWLSVPLCALTMPVDADDRRIDHRVLHVGIVGHRVEHALEHVGLHPIAEAL